KYVNNQETSDFSSQYVDYYKAANPGDLDYGYFQRIFFDRDNNIYDQYTFGVGPEMIVQVRFDMNCGAEVNTNATVVIHGGQGPYNLHIADQRNGSYDYTVESSPFQFEAYIPNRYTVNVTDANGVTAEVSVFSGSETMEIELGEDRILSADLQEVTLEAGQNINDPEATYKWFRNNVLLEEFGSTLIVTEPGEYKVEVTSGNRVCQKTDSVRVYYQFSGNVTQVMDCTKPKGAIGLTVSGGIPPYTTVISGTNQTLYQVHATENFVFSDIEFGPNTLTTTDSNGEVFTSDIILQAPLEGIQLDLLSQLQQNCTPFGIDDAFVCYNVVLNAGALITTPNVSYEWFMNGVSANIYTPTITTYPDDTVPGLSNEVKVKVTNLITGCSATETFRLSRSTGIKSVNSPVTNKTDNSPTANNPEKQESKAITAKVYPNPGTSGATFFYEVSATEIFNGTIEIFSPTGALLHQEVIKGQSNYKLPFNLATSGIYFICTKTNGILLTDKIIIR
ncbi:MAG: T9SS type A sorting domain-containing protein, partial [Flavobacterium sp.]|nr:T9SS type A sorting domain-containing protein [Flavobacterium sp.]